VRTLRHRFATTALVLLVLSAAACGGSGAPEGDDAGGPERTDLRVGVLATWDAAAVYLAVDRGYFRAEGLTVTPVVLANAEEAVSRNLSGAIDIAHDGYVTPILAASKGLRLRIIVDSARAGRGMYVVVTPNASAVHAPKDLAGTTIGMTNSKGLPALLTRAALRSAGVDASGVRFVDVTYPTMGAALQNGSVDASFATDPFLARFKQTLGARVVLDTIGGRTDDFPIGCYHTTQRFAEQNPRTVAAFRRAMARAHRLATHDRHAVTRMLPRYISGLTAQAADTITIGAFSPSNDRSLAQRVADFMTQQHMLNGHFDVASLVE
jgi:NitT/TauT family transport system substrate-binding protein